jgi:hypothetical protein
MTKVLMVARDTVHISSVKSEPLQPGEEFEIGEAEAKSLEKRGLASRKAAEAEGLSTAPARRRRT